MIRCVFETRIHGHIVLNDADNGMQMGNKGNRSFSAASATAPRHCYPSKRLPAGIFIYPTTPEISLELRENRWLR
jgi:hypothetical protein